MTEQTTARESAPHPSDLDLALFVQTGLSPEYTEHVLHHVADCAECTEVIAAALQSQELLSKTPGRSPVLRRSATTLDAAQRSNKGRFAAALAAAAILAFMAATLATRSEPNPAIRPLILAMSEYRTVEPRITGGFRASTLQDTLRGNHSEPQSSWRVVAAAEAVRLASASLPTAQRLANEGVALLVTGNLDAAIENLQCALALQDGPDVRNDLAAAFLERSRRQTRAPDAIRALELLSGLLEHTPGHREAMFNFALAQEYLGLRAKAARAYAAFIIREHDASWTLEAKRRRTALNRGDPPRTPGRISLRELEERTLPELARGVFGLPTPGARVIQTYGAYGALAPVVRQLHGSHGRQIAAGVLLISEAASLRRAGDRVTPGSRLREAESLLSSNFRMYALRARFEYLVWDIEMNGASRDPRAFQMLADDAHSRDWALLEARCLGQKGLALTATGDLKAAAQCYQRASALLRCDSDNTHSAAVEVLAADLFEAAGDEGEAWKARSRALPRLEGLMPELRVHALLATGIQAGRIVEAPRAVDLWLGEVIDALARRAGADGRRMVRGMTSLQRETYERVAAERQRRIRAPKYLDDLNSQVREWPSGLLAGRRADPDRYPMQAPLISEAHRLRAFLMRRADLRMADGDTSGSAKDTRFARDLLHEARLADAEERRQARTQRIGSPGSILPLLEPPDPLMVSSSLRRLGGLFSAGQRFAPATHLDSTSRIQAKLGSEAEILWFHASPAKILATSITRGEVRRWEVPATTAEITVAIAEFAAALAAGADPARLPGERLSQLLFGSHYRSHAPKSLVVVPDGPLRRLAFASLPVLSPPRPLGAVSALTVAVNSILGPAITPSSEQPQRALVLVDPATDSGFSRLPGSLREGRAIVARYPDGLLLWGEDATPAALVQLAPHSPILHLSAHSLNAPEGDRALLLAGADGTLTSRVISELNLTGVDVVVLAVCSGAAGASYEEDLSLARAFLHAGARCVISNAKAISDTSTESFVTTIHEGLARGLGPAEALRVARARDFGLATRESAPAWPFWELIE